MGEYWDDNIDPPIRVLVSKQINKATFKFIVLFATEVQTLDFNSNSLRESGGKRAADPTIPVRVDGGIRLV